MTRKISAKKKSIARTLILTFCAIALVLNLVFLGVAWFSSSAIVSGMADRELEHIATLLRDNIETAASAMKPDAVIEATRAGILAIKVGFTGYPYVMDMQGNILIHPTLEGKKPL